jgi:outer membrane protein
MKKHLLVVWCLLFLLVSGAAGQIPTNPDSSLHAILDTLSGTRISLEEAVAGASNQSTRLKIAEAAYLAAKGAARRERGIFDPALFFSLNYADDHTPTASFFAGAPILNTVETDATAGLRWQFPTGTGLEATLNTIKLRTNSSFAFLNPQYNAFGTLRLRQSILGGLWVSGKKNLNKADSEAGTMKARYEQERVATASEAERKFWDLYGAERNYAVQRLIRDQAIDFVRDTEIKARAGLYGPSETASARTFLAEQELLLIDREDQLAVASEKLADEIGGRPDLRYITTGDPPSDYALEPADVLLARAMERNLSLEAARADIEAKKALADAAGWEWLPTLDLVGSIGGSGLSGNAQRVVFGGDTLITTTGGPYSDAISEAIDRKFPNWSVGVELSFPIGFRKGRGEKDRLEAELMAAGQRYTDEERKVRTGLMDSYRDIANVSRRLEFARRGVEEAAEQVRIGRIEFENGRATAFELVRLTADFATAQNRYSDALVKTAKSAATLRQYTTGTIPADLSQGKKDADDQDVQK